MAVERFAEFIRRDDQPLLERLFTAAELEYALPRRRAAEHLAARFAAKEAFVKALGCGLRDGLSWTDIEVVNDELGAPRLRLGGCAAALLRQRNLAAPHLSCSHERECAVAVVILETL